MPNDITALFDEPVISKIKVKLPYLFTLAEAEASRGGKVGMEIGSTRERIIIALLRHFFGKENISDDIPITEKYTDVLLFDRPISIKTKTGTSFTGIKVVWTVDWDKIAEFVRSYTPKTDILLVNIVWNNSGGFYHIPIKVQKKVFSSIGRARFLKTPPRGTNPRGVEYSKEAIKMMLEEKDTNRIIINWVRKDHKEIDAYEKWEKYWAED